MKCPYCQRPVKPFNFRRSNPIKKVLPRCGACHRYVLTWAHWLILAALALALALATFLALFRLLDKWSDPPAKPRGSKKVKVAVLAPPVPAPKLPAKPKRS